MAAAISRRLTSKLLKPHHHSSFLFSPSSAYISHNSQPLNPNPIPQQNLSNPTSNLSPFTFNKSHSSQYPKPMINLNQFLIRSYTNSRSTTQSHSLVKKTQRQKNPNFELLNQENPKRFFCTSDSSKEEKPTSPSPYPCQNPEFKEGPTVERDPSAMDKDARDVLQSMMKNICSLSKALAIMGLIQLGLGAWISYITNSSPFTLSTEVSILGFLFFGFPLAAAFGLRQLLKHFVYVFNVMEELGSFQIPTPTLQKAKNLNLHLVRLRGFSYLCIGGASIVMVCNALARLT